MSVNRRLAAILSADVVGYSRLMGTDEAGTLERLKALRAEAIDPVIAAHGGRIVKLMGDGTLVEFASVVGAVDCAVEIQHAVAEANGALAEDQRIVFRIGVNLGDVIIDGDDIYGDGVNVAARLQEIAEPGGVCLSGSVYDQVKGKVEAAFENLGEREVKNIAEPVRVYRVVAAGDTADAMTQSTHSPPLPDRPSIAVLPFVNMSGDPEQEYFSDGITEDIITELSRFHSLFVIARNSSFHYKGQSPKIQDVGRELGVQYVVEGSVRKAGNRVRVTAQLVETANGNHLWAERYDRDLEDIFAVQDELVGEIAAAVPGQLDATATQRARRKPVENLTAYDYVLRGEWLISQEFGSPEIRALFEKAIEIDPLCARAYTRLATWHAYSVYAHGASADEATQLARSLAEKAMGIDPNDPAVLGVAAGAYVMVGEHDLARRHIEKAISLNPNDYLVMLMASLTLAYLGDHEDALDWMRLVSRHDPYAGDAMREYYFDAYYMARRYEDAIGSIKGWHDPPPHMLAEIAAAYAQADRMDDARATVAKYRETRPAGDSGAEFVHAHVRMCARQEDADHWLEGYRKAGLDV